MMAGRNRRKNDPNAQRVDETYLQWQSRLQRQRQEERDRNQPLIPDEARQHGDYRRAFVTDVDTGTKADTLVNRGGTPVERWINANRLTQNQMAALDHCLRLWRLAGTSTPLTAQYGERMPTTGSSERVCAGEIEARDDLRRLEKHFGGYWLIFENVVRNGHASGQAGEVAGYGQREAPARVFHTVCMVADMVFDMERL